VNAILIISVFLICVASFALLRTKRSSSNESSGFLPPGPDPRGLFGNPATGYLGDGDDAFDDAEKKSSEEFEKSLIERAGRGELEVLRDAHAAGNAKLYRRILDALVERAAKTPSDLRALVAFVTQSGDLRASPALAELLLEDWEQTPTLAATAELLRVAALSDDAATFERALTAVLRAWEEARLSGLSAGELRSLFEGEYWLLSSEAKSSGAGFALKQKLADARRRLSQSAPRETPPTAGDFSDEVSAQRERP
jgi:hypothetical protein